MSDSLRTYSDCLFKCYKCGVKYTVYLAVYIQLLDFLWRWKISRFCWKRVMNSPGLVLYRSLAGAQQKWFFMFGKPIVLNTAIELLKVETQHGIYKLSSNFEIKNRVSRDLVLGCPRQDAQTKTIWYWLSRMWYCPQGPYNTQGQVRMYKLSEYKKNIHISDVTNLLFYEQREEEHYDVLLVR